MPTCSAHNSPKTARISKFFGSLVIHLFLCFQPPNLKDASEIEFYGPESDEKALPPVTIGISSSAVPRMADLLPSKTVPARGGGASSKPQTRLNSTATKRKQSDDSTNASPPKTSRRATIQEVEGEGDAPVATGVKKPI
ncbi:hypothetical protein B0H13DRAFT_2306929 [Mycena leptocephala]|nr:hypothetical protein B0H13DRAFT_2306929 [Mycena leptocephala]